MSCLNDVNSRVALLESKIKEVEAENIELKERLRDEFAIEIIGKLVQKLNFDGMYREEFKGDSVLLGQAAYLIADAALKAREQSK